MKNKQNIKTYAYKLLKRKTYFIKELYDKLLINYQIKDVNILIKELIKKDLINDKKLLKIKIDNLVNYKMYGYFFIIDYLKKYHLSNNLINFVVSDYIKTINENKNKIINNLKENNKPDDYIKYVLLKKGYIQKYE